MHDITTATLDETLATGTVLVDFWAPWCPPCRAMRPNLERVAEEFSDRVTIVKMDIESEKDMTTRFGFTSIPVLILFQDGEEIARRAGAGGYAALKDFLNQHLKESA